MTLIVIVKQHLYQKILKRQGSLWKVLATLLFSNFPLWQITLLQQNSISFIEMAPCSIEMCSISPWHRHIFSLFFCGCPAAVRDVSLRAHFPRIVLSPSLLPATCTQPYRTNAKRSTIACLFLCQFATNSVVLHWWRHMYKGKFQLIKKKYIHLLSHSFSD